MPREFPSRPLLPAAQALWEPLLRRLLECDFSSRQLLTFFSNPELRFDPEPMRRKLLELLRLHYNSDRTLAIQKALKELGFDPGPLDGIAGSGTRRAISDFCQAHDLPPNSEPDQALLARLVQQKTLPPAGCGQQKSPAPPKPVSTSADALVHPHLLRQERLEASIAYYRRHGDVLLAMEQRHGIPREIAVAIFSAETDVGRYLGPHKTLAVHASMVLARDYAVIRPYLDVRTPDADKEAFLREKAFERGERAFGELIALLRYALRNEHDPVAMPCSVYGAFGLGQFMPSTALAYGVDGDGDGRVDLFKARDAAMSLGTFLNALGWTDNALEPERQRKILLHYNRSQRYVNSVLAIASSIRQHV